MSATQISTTARGTYHWELVFDYDNTGNTGTITEKRRIKTARTVTAKEFLSNKFNINTGFSFRNQSSVSMKFEGVGEASDQTEFSYHLDLAYELVKTTETATVVDESNEVEREFNVAGGDHLTLYRLCYSSDGVKQDTDVLRATSKERPGDVNIDLKFTCARRILGLDEILDLFGHTTPSRDNTVEWANVRNSIISYVDRPQEERFRHFVDVLHTIEPSISNRVEWADIRQTCGELQSAWESEDKQLLLKKLLTRFSATTPRSDNTDEWRNIRALSDEILAGVQQRY